MITSLGSGVTTPEISLILPAYNEASRQETKGGPEGEAFKRAVGTYQDFLSNSFDNWELSVVSDGSTDGTVELAESLGVDNVIAYEQNRGRGYALRLGYLAARGGVRIYTDSDGSYGPKTIQELFDEVDGGADIAVAYRAGEAQHESMARKYGHWAMHRLCEIIAPTGIKDPQAGAKAFSADAANLIWGNYVTQERWAADRQAMFHARKLGLDVAQVPAEITPVGDSRVKVINDAVDMVADSIHIRLDGRNGQFVTLFDNSVSKLAASTKAGLNHVLDKAA